MTILLHRVHRDIRTPPAARRVRIRSPRDQSGGMLDGIHEQYAIGHYNKSGLFAAKLFESYSVGIVNLGLFSLEGTLHQIPNPLRRLLAFMDDPVHLLDDGHFNA